MKIKNLLLFAAAASLSLSAFAQDLETGEWAVLEDGSPAKIGQTTNDHVFARNAYDDVNPGTVYDNFVTFKAGTPQTVWFWLDDDDEESFEFPDAVVPMTVTRDPITHPQSPL